MINDDRDPRSHGAVPGTLEEIAARLIDAANEAGGKDNISVVLLRYTA